MFRLPAVIDEDGLFMTLAQFQFFLNRSNGEKLFREKDYEFIKYYNQCRIYNLIYDLSDEDEESAQFYWDHENENLGVLFPKNGKVDNALDNIDIVDFEDDADDFNIEF